MSFNSNHVASRLYYDIMLSNLNSTTSASPIITFNETRSNPFVYCPENYFLSIIRFSLDTCSLPIWVPTIQGIQSDPNLTIYSVSMTYNGYTVQTYMNFIPQDKTQTTPVAPSQTSTGLQIFCDYYYVYNYDYVIYLLNNTLETCFNSLAALTALPTSNISYLKWDTTNNIATLISDQNGFNDTSDDYIGVYFNNALYQLFVSLPMTLQSTTSSNGLNYQISTSNYGNANTENIDNYTAQLVVQEYSTISVWNPVMSVVFTSNTLPIVSEQLSAPLVFINGLTKQSTNISAIANVLTDFATDGIYKPSLLYQPYVYRYIEMIGNSPLSSFDITIYWKNRYSELIPFQLNAGCTATIKMMFTLKNTQ